MEHFNFLVVLAAAIAAFGLGAVWYAPPVFGNAWMKANNLTKDSLQGRNMGKIFGLAFLFTFIMAAVLSLFVNNHVEPHDFHAAVLTGFAGGIFIVCSFAIVALFEGRSASYVLINGGYCFVALELMAAIIGWWK